MSNTFVYSAIRGSSGYSGLTGNTGVQGAQGAKGSTGVQGAVGTNGVQGAQGATGAGAQGVSGYSGFSGAIGAQGTNGTVGSNGAQGISGYSGFSGISGTNATTVSVTYSNSFTAGQAIYRITGGYALGQANSVSAADILGVVTSSTGTAFTYVANGYATGFTGLVDAANYYLSETTAGALTTNPPSAVGMVIKPVLIAIGSTAAQIVEYPGAQVQPAGSNSGYSGFSGLKGSTGAQGAQGTAGTNGIQGAQGASGYSGFSGAFAGTGVSGYGAMFTGTNSLSANSFFFLGGNVGVNNATPGYTLDVGGSVMASKGYSDASGTASVLRISQPGGAAGCYTGASTVTGAIKITLPQSWTNTMMRMTVKIYTYDGLSCEINLGGYNYAGSTTWINTFADMTTGARPPLNIRWGHDGTYCCMYIGETNTVWAYPQVFVTDFQAGHSNIAASQWNSGWSVSFATSLGTLTGGTISTAGVVYGSVGNFTGNVGIGTSSPFADSGYTSLDIRGSSTGSEINLGTTATMVGQIVCNATTGLILNTVTATPLKFFTNGAERARIDSSGNVGIGTSSPNVALTVSGSVSATGTIYQGSTPITTLGKSVAMSFVFGR